MARIEVAQNELDRIEREGAQLGDAERAARQYRAELVAARKALRNVQGNLRRDIDRLAGQVTFVNIVVMPIFVRLAALALAWRSTPPPPRDTNCRRFARCEPRRGRG